MGAKCPEFLAGFRSEVKCPKKCTTKDYAFSKQKTVF
jgi:hypothetical protein